MTKIQKALFALLICAAVTICAIPTSADGIIDQPPQNGIIDQPPANDDTTTLDVIVAIASGLLNILP